MYMAKTYLHLFLFSNLTCHCFVFSWEISLQLAGCCGGFFYWWYHHPSDPPGDEDLNVHAVSRDKDVPHDDQKALWEMVSKIGDHLSVRDKEMLCVRNGTLWRSLQKGQLCGHQLVIPFILHLSLMKKNCQVHQHVTMCYESRPSTQSMKRSRNIYKWGYWDMMDLVQLRYHFVILFC